MKKINFKNKFQKFTDQWSPKVIAELNDYQFKLVKIQNDFIWHEHNDTDEVFIGKSLSQSYSRSGRADDGYTDASQVQ